MAIVPYQETGWRIVANDITCPNGNGQSGCMDLAYPVNFAVYGNAIHDVASNLAPGSVTGSITACTYPNRGTMLILAGTPSRACMAAAACKST